MDRKLNTSKKYPMNWGVWSVELAAAKVESDTIAVSSVSVHRTMAVHINATTHLIDLTSSRAVSRHVLHDLARKNENERRRLARSGDAGSLVSSGVSTST